MSEVKKLRPVSKAELAAKGVSALADRPNTRKQYGVGGLTAQELKAWFDKLSVFLAEKINEIQDTISEDGASDYIKIDTDDANIATLGDLVRAIYSGYLSERALNVSVTGLASGTLRYVLTRLNQEISLNSENIDTLMANAGIRISSTMSGNIATVRLTNSTGKVLAFITLDLTATTDRIADGAVTMPKIAAKSLSTDAFADQSVSTRTIQPKAVTEDKLSAELLVKLANLAGGALSGVSFDSAANRITVTNAAGQSFSAEIVFDSSDIDADPKGTAKKEVAGHNTDMSAHADLRSIVYELRARLSAIADSDDGTLDQLSEIVAYIKNNKNLIENITTSKVSYADIVNDLVTGGEKKALSAAQGVKIKALIDALDRDKASQAELASELERLLREAKDSGEFDGESISITSTEESSESGGISVVTFSDGSKLSVKNGYTPYIGENGNWYIGTVDTTIKAKGEDGKDGKFVYEELTDEQIMEIRADVNNLIPFPYYSGSVGTVKTVNGVTFTVNQDRSITLNGTPTATYTQFVMFRSNTDIGLFTPGETYRISAGTTLPANTNLYVYYLDENGTGKWAINTIKWKTGYQLLQCYLQINSTSTTFNNLTIYPSIRVGGATPIKGTDYFTDEDKAEIVDTVRFGSIPDYWHTALDEGAEAINTALCTAGADKSAFLFYTDAHWNYGSQTSPKLLKYLHRHTGMTKTFFGGDIVNDEGTDYGTMSYLWDWREELKDLPNHHSAVGNHDDGNATNNLFSEQYVYGYLLAAEETPDVVRTKKGMYYYVDSPAERTRYLFLDTAYMGVDTAQKEFIKGALLGTPDGWHIAAVAHIWYDTNYDTTPPTVGELNSGASSVLSMFDSYNSRTGDYAECGGWVEFCVGGHTHWDFDGASATGIPIILAETDSKHVRSGLTYTAGTTSEASVNGIIADYGNHKIYVVRIGRGESREVEITNYTVSYTNLIPTATDLNGNVVGFVENSRWSSSSGAFVDQTGWDSVGFIPCSQGDVIRFANMTIQPYTESVNSDRGGIQFWSEDKTSIAMTMLKCSDTSAWGSYLNPKFDDDGSVTEITVPTTDEYANVGYFLVTCQDVSEASIITINETIE